MGLSSDLISEFVKATNDEQETQHETTVYATVVESDGRKYVRIDGSDLLTPVSATATVNAGDRVTVMIKSHTAMITGNISSPSATSDAVIDLGNNVVKVDRLLANKANVEDLKTEQARIDDLQAENVQITERLDAAEANIEELDTFDLTAVNADIENLKTANADISGKLEAAEASIETLETEVADVNTLIFGSASGTTIQTSFANAIIAQLGDAQIKSAMIESVAADKILAGDILTNNVRVMSEDGKLLISDETIQISDDTRVRVQIGKDSSGDYSVNIWDADGNLMFSEGGITDNAIKEAIIRNDMISEDADISASKLDIDSLFSEINGSTNTIKSTKIYLDDEKQTLDVVFKELDTTVTDHGTRISSQGTNISAIQGQIQSKIWQQDIDTATGEMETKYSELEQTVDGLSVEVGDAAKTATNYLSYDGTNGLQIGNKSTGSWSGFRTQITNQAFRILSSAGTVLASYGEKLIELGKNATDAVIKLCGGKGTIQYVTDEDSNTEYLEVAADKIRVKSNASDAMSSIYSMYTDESTRWEKSAVNVTPTTVDIYASECVDASLPDRIESWNESIIQVTPDSVTIAALADIYLQPSQGSVMISGEAEFEGRAKFGGEIYDRFGKVVSNGLAVYKSDMIDANTTSDALIITTLNTPDTSLWYVETMFYSNKIGNRAQRATPYRFAGAVYRRYYYNGAWSAWTKDLCESDEHNHEFVTSAGGFRFAQGWLGIYDSTANAATHTSRKGYLGYDGGSSMIIADQNNGGIDLKSGNTIRFYGGGNTSTFVGVLNDRMVPSSNDSYYLGDSSRKWKAVYAVNGTVQTSDRNLKTDISEIDDKYVRLFDMLRPVSFRFSDPDSDRVHIGYISQDVKEAMDTLGISDLEFAGYCRDATTECDKDGNTIFTYSLRYSEFIALNSKMIQLNRKKIAEQQSQIDELRAELNELKQLLISK